MPDEPSQPQPPAGWPKDPPKGWPPGAPWPPRLQPGATGMHRCINSCVAQLGPEWLWLCALLCAAENIPGNGGVGAHTPPPIQWPKDPPAGWPPGVPWPPKLGPGAAGMHSCINRCTAQLGPEWLWLCALLCAAENIPGNGYPGGAVQPPTQPPYPWPKDPPPGWPPGVPWPPVIVYGPGGPGLPTPVPPQPPAPPAPPTAPPQPRPLLSGPETLVLFNCQKHTVGNLAPGERVRVTATYNGGGFLGLDSPGTIELSVNGTAVGNLVGNNATYVEGPGKLEIHLKGPEDRAQVVITPA